MGQAGAAALLRCARDLGAVEAFSMPDYSVYTKQYDMIIVSFYISIQHSIRFALLRCARELGAVEARSTRRDGPD